MKVKNFIIPFVLVSFVASQDSTTIKPAEKPGTAPVQTAPAPESAQTPAPAAPAKSPQAPLKHTIAVLDLDLQGIAETAGKALTDLLRTEIVRTEKFEVMERGKMDEIMKEQGFQKSGACTDEACLVEMGQLLGVDAMIAGSIGKLGKLILINLRMIDIQTGKIVKTVSQDCKCELENLPLAIRVAAGKLADLNVDAQVKELNDATEQAGIEKKQEALQAQQAAAQAAAAAQPQVKKESGGAAGKVVIGVLLLGAAGGAVYAITSAKKDEGASPGPDLSNQLPDPPIPTRQ